MIQGSLEDLQMAEFTLRNEINNIENILMEKKDRKIDEENSKSTRKFRIERTSSIGLSDIKQFRRRKYSEDNFKRCRKCSKEKKDKIEQVPSYSEFFNINNKTKPTPKLSVSKSAINLSHKTKTLASKSLENKPKSNRGEIPGATVNGLPQGVTVIKERLPNEKKEGNFSSEEKSYNEKNRTKRCQQNNQSLDLLKMLQTSGKKMTRNQSTSRIVSHSSKIQAPNTTLPEYRRSSPYLLKSQREDKLICNKSQEKRENSLIQKIGAFGKENLNIKEPRMKGKIGEITNKVERATGLNLGDPLEYDNFWTGNVFRNLLNQEGFGLMSDLPVEKRQLNKNNQKIDEREHIIEDKHHINKFISRNKSSKMLNTRYQSLERKDYFGDKNKNYTPKTREPTLPDEFLALRDKTNELRVSLDLKKGKENFIQRKNENSHRSRLQGQERKELKNVDKVYGSLNTMKTKNWTPLLSKKI